MTLPLKSELDIAIAADALQGLDAARSFKPDVVLCDTGLPGIDGFEVARRMRADPLLAKACLVALSGYAAPEDVAKSSEAGFRSHLAKPPDIAALEETLTWRLRARAVLERPGSVIHGAHELS